MRKRSPQSGYVAIITTVVISLMLLSIIARGGLAGWYTRAMVLDREKKDQANELAYGCVRQVVASIIRDPSLANLSIRSAGGICIVQSADLSDQHNAVIEIEAQVGSVDTGGIAFTHLKISVDFADVYLGADPLESHPAGSDDLDVVIRSIQEIP